MGIWGSIFGGGYKDDIQEDINQLKQDVLNNQAHSQSQSLSSQLGNQSPLTSYGQQVYAGSGQVLTGDVTWKTPGGYTFVASVVPTPVGMEYPSYDKTMIRKKEEQRITDILMQETGLEDFVVEIIPSGGTYGVWIRTKDFGDKLLSYGTLNDDLCRTLIKGMGFPGPKPPVMETQKDILIMKPLSFKKKE